MIDLKWTQLESREGCERTKREYSVARGRGLVWEGQRLFFGGKCVGLIQPLETNQARKWRGAVFGARPMDKHSATGAREWVENNLQIVFG